MFDVVADLTNPKPASIPPPLPPPYSPPTSKKERRETIQIPSPIDCKLPVPLSTAATSSPGGRHMSLQLTPTSPVFSFNRLFSIVDNDEDGWKEKEVVKRSGATAQRIRVFDLEDREQLWRLSRLLPKPPKTKRVRTLLNSGHS